MPRHATAKGIHITSMTWRICEAIAADFSVPPLLWPRVGVRVGSQLEAVTIRCQSVLHTISLHHVIVCTSASAFIGALFLLHIFANIITVIRYQLQHDLAIRTPPHLPA